jgi:hypothetical protein
VKHAAQKIKNGASGTKLLWLRHKNKSPARGWVVFDFALWLPASAARETPLLISDAHCQSGEETNQLDYFFARISERYIEEVEYQTSPLSSVMEPLVIIFLSLIVGTILISKHLPMFEMNNMMR